MFIMREKTEGILEKIKSELDNIDVILENEINTPVKNKNTGEQILDIYYRTERNEIRVYIRKDDETMYSKYLSLLKKEIVYQKESANPESTPGWFSFFVDETNVEYVLRFLLQ